MKTKKFLKGDEKKELVAYFMDGYATVECAEKFDVCYKTALDIIRPTRIALRKKAEVDTFLDGMPRLVKKPEPTIDAVYGKADNWPSMNTKNVVANKKYSTTNIPMSTEAEDFIVGLSLVHQKTCKEVVDMVIKVAREKYATI
tara:strand:- start:722 stop:1150 length:429 start_codon:yes stop_codon:yes gene_type:complete